ncbi:glycoside hydrolase family 16 protein [Laetiporus sulphureus 93-53]|uniref:Glycoside hydrolase family 16 protein n=1 Tax=Laetiporus sulphureus 93-53 TaxID=1314785 RepID=A0A165E0A4_9APHY|nr:glycoside hydrolase family 16 protein [Laetiporus sulphureus 93-53]KZT06000.1 glycoside hydrolase family 16 protein [Laetiporus sulphureus 93-53]
MASLGPNSQRRYVQPDSPSTTNLLSPQSRLSPNGAQGAQSPRSVHSMASLSSLNESRYASSVAGSIPASISDKFSLSPDPSSWGADLSPDHPESDDFLHNPDPKRDRKNDQGGNIFTYRGIINLGCLFVLFTGIMMLFAGYPIISHFMKKNHSYSTTGASNVGGSSSLAKMGGSYDLIDPDTPEEAHSKADYVYGKNWTLVFSDEFNVDGRTFWPGDDPYWEALDLHYWQTNNLEWLSPTAITTANGSLEITMSKKPQKGLNFTSGMMTTWNKFCFTGGIVEVSVQLPGYNNIVGFWPAIWTMGNLGRAGYGASLDGLWPYTYDDCDVGTAQNQTIDGKPVAATENGDPYNGGVLSYLPGQRLSRCSCPGSSHPGPMHTDGTYVGRAAPEIDIFEALVSDGKGQVSQSGQWGPFNYEYIWHNTTDNYSIGNSSLTELNPYLGGVYQQATSALTWTDQTAYELNGGGYATYGIQYKPGFDDAYISWIASGEVAWTLDVAGMSTDSVVNISSRPVSQEPMYLIMNLGMSENFGYVDLDQLPFPATMRVDYVRVYQDPDEQNVGCDPTDFPTAAYIDKYIEAYTNPNLTTWTNDYGQPYPKNRLLEAC